MMLDKGQIKDWDGEPEGAVTGANPSGNADAFLGAREAIPTGERIQLTPEEAAARRKRSRWIALALGGFVVLVFLLTMAKVGGGAGVPEVYRIPTSSSQ